MASLAFFLYYVLEFNSIPESAENPGFYFVSHTSNTTKYKRHCDRWERPVSKVNCCDRRLKMEAIRKGNDLH